jgi:HD-GYP domain-containing protein (c-di-GMP phosphodiesterase class II)
MSTTSLLSNVPFLEYLPVGMTVLDAEWHVVYVNEWMRERLRGAAGNGAGIELPRELNDLMSWGDAGWRDFVRSVPSMGARATGDFCLKLVTPVSVVGSGGAVGDVENACMQVSVSFHRLNAPLDNSTVMVVSDITAIRLADERLKETLAQVTELSDTAVSQAVELKRLNAALEERVRGRTTELRAANMDALHMLAVACEAKDHDTGEHVLRVQRYTELLARELGFSVAEAGQFGYSSVLHDVGKVHIPDAILAKPGSLTEEERKIINEHPAAGERILGANPFFASARRIARAHHENWDGSGYPEGLSRYGICAEARIVHVADVYDALTSRRPYKAAWGQTEALRAIGEASGKAFDPEVVAALISLASRSALQPAIVAA